MSEMVARTRMALFARHIPQRGGAGDRPRPVADRAREVAQTSFSPLLPFWLMPVGHLLTSAANTGTPMRELLGQGLGDRLAGADGAIDQATWRLARPGAVAVGGIAYFCNQGGSAMVLYGGFGGKSKIRPDRLNQLKRTPWQDTAKWANIQHRKAARTKSAAKHLDPHRLKSWSPPVRVGRPAANPRLRLAIDKAKANMPADPSSATSTSHRRPRRRGLREIRYEGYGIGGAAIIDTMTDNPCAPWPRCATPSASTAATWALKVRVAFQFKHCGPAGVHAPLAPTRQGHGSGRWRPAPRT